MNLYEMVDELSDKENKSPQHGNVDIAMMMSDESVKESNENDKTDDPTLLKVINEGDHDDNASTNTTATPPLSDSHPLLNRVQTALQKQLLKTLERVEQEYLEKQEHLRQVKRQHEDCGVSLYGMQKQLVVIQSSLEKSEKENESLVNAKTEKEIELVGLRNQYQQSQSKADEITKHVSESQKEVEFLQESLRQMKIYDKTIQSEIAANKRVTEKTEESTKGLEKSLVKQDYYIDGLHDQLRKLKADITLSDSRLSFYEDEIKESREMVQETSKELELIIFEKKQLMLQWKSSLLSLTRRDEALAAANSALQEAKSATKDNDVEIDGLNRELKQLKVKYENLSSLNDRLESEGQFVDDIISKLNEQQQVASVKYEMLEKSILKMNEKEEAAKAYASKLESKISSVNHNIEMSRRQRHEVEERIASVKYEQSAVSKATKNLKKSEKNLISKIHEKEIDAANIQNEIARIQVEKLNVERRIKLLQEELDKQEQGERDKEKLMECKETELKRRSDDIEKKMKQVDKLNRQYEKMLDGVDEPESLGPLEATIKSLHRDIEKEEHEIKSMQRKWLTNQTTLVQTIDKTDEGEGVNRELSARGNILNQKRLRLLQQINMSEAEIKNLEYNVQGMHSDMSRLNSLIGRHTLMENDLKHENVIKDQEFSQELQELETECKAIEINISAVKVAKEGILKDIIHVEEQIIGWEKKIQLEKETRQALENAEDKNEIKGMEREIHRMKYRLQDMNREQETIVREMERAIYKREDIAVKYSNRGRGSGGSVRNNNMTSAELQRRLSEGKKKLISLNRLSSEHSRIIDKMREELVEITGEIESSSQKLQIVEEESQLFEERMKLHQKP